MSFDPGGRKQVSFDPGLEKQDKCPSPQNRYQNNHTSQLEKMSSRVLPLPAAKTWDSGEDSDSGEEDSFGYFPESCPPSQEAREAAAASGARALALVRLSELAARPAAEVDEEKMCVI